MGRIECDQHGRSPIAWTCSELAEDARAGRALRPRAEYPLELDGEPIHRHDFCLSCVEQHGLPTPPRPLDMEQRDALPTVPVCARCYDEASRL